MIGKPDSEETLVGTGLGWANRLGDPRKVTSILQRLLAELRPARSGYGSPPDPNHYLDAFHIMFTICLKNNPQYKDSWCKRGAFGIFANIARKFDRMDAQFEDGKPFEANEIVDLAVYSWRDLAWYLRNDPQRIVDWAKKEGLWDEGDGIIK